MHVALLGDSTFDNKPYTDGGPDVVTHLRRLLSGFNQATLFAVDGAVIDDVGRQLERLKGLLEADDSNAPTHIALSVGGNDLLGEVEVLSSAARTVGEGLLLVSATARRFGEHYRGLLAEVLELRLPTVLCTVYHGAFPDPAQADMIATALRVFDHEIVEAGLDDSLPIVDLRRVCNEAEDYWNPIEPNERGGAKIAAAVLGALRAPRYDVAGPPVTVQGTGGLPR